MFRSQNSIKMKILLLEDTPLYGEAIVGNLKEMGYEVSWADNSKDALDEISGTEPPDICLFDIQLEGEKILGTDVARKVINELPKPLPVIIYTSYSKDSEKALRAQHAGVPPQFFIDRNITENKIQLQGIIEAAAEYYGPQQTIPNEQIFYGARKIGICINASAPRQYRFISKDEIMYIQSGGGALTSIHIFDTVLHLGTNVGQIGKQLQINFPNIIRLNQIFWINLEQMATREGDTLYFTNGETIPLNEPARARLKQLHLMLSAH